MQALRRQVWRASMCLAYSLTIIGVSVLPGYAQPLQPPVSSSPFHQLQDGNGRIIPCRCTLFGQMVPLGTTICMQTHLGPQMTRCDLATNITTWAPTGVPCEISHSPKPTHSAT